MRLEPTGITLDGAQPIPLRFVGSKGGQIAHPWSETQVEGAQRGENLSPLWTKHQADRPVRQDDLLAILDAGPMEPADLAFMSAQRRKQALISIETLIDLLDAIEPDPDLEPSFGYLPHGAVADECEPEVDDEDGGDNEPNLGSIGSCGDLWMSQTRWSKGNGKDLEEECEDEGACVQSQPHDSDPDEGSLGSLDRRINQTRWAGDTSWDDGGGAELDPEKDDCHRAHPRNKRELKTNTKHTVVRRQRIAHTERPEDVARRARQQLDALRDKRRKHVLPKSNLTQVRADVVLWHRGGRHG